MAAQQSAPSRDDNNRAIEIVRLIDAPPDLVFKAWSTPHHLGNWFGPRGFTTTTSEFALRPGGVWRFILHGPDGTNYRNHIRFVEVVPSERLVYEQNGGDDTDSPLFHVTVTFAEESGRTRLTLRMVFDSPATRASMVKFGAVEGGEQTTARLAEYMSSLGAGEFVLERSFAAPRDLVWRAWTQADHLARWWGPKGCTINVLKLELRPGGLFHYRMEFGAMTSWARWVFRDIEPPRRLVFLSGFSDEQAGSNRHPLQACWPLDLLTTIEFVELEKRTLVRIRWAPWNASESERAAFESAYDSCFGGWSGSLDKLDDHLSSVTKGATS